MPQLGETVTEGTIIRWHKQVGDEVAVDDVLFEVSTEKVDTEVPSAHAGVLRAVHVPEGDTVPVGTLLAVITDTADEPLEEAAAASPPASTPASAEAVPPAWADGTSVSTFSVETSNSTSSTATSSPTCLCHRMMVPSVTVSPSCGIVTSSTGPPYGGPDGPVAPRSTLPLVAERGS